MPDASFRRAQQHYARIRETAYALIQNDALTLDRVQVPLRLAGCTVSTLSAWRTSWTEPHPTGWGGWDWEPLLRRAWRNPTSIHLAIWSGDTLCGLAVGHVSDANVAGVRNAVVLDYLESAHDPHHPLRGTIAYLAISAAHAYGRLLGTRFLRLREPLPGIIDLYVGLGFEIVRGDRGVLYCERRIGP